MSKPLPSNMFLKHIREGEGFLLSYIYREAFNRIDLVTLDAQYIDNQPLALIQLPH